MRNDATARMKNLFTSNHTLLVSHGLKRLIEETPRVAVQHALSAVKPQTLHDRLTANLEFSQDELSKDCRRFFKHAIRLAEAFQIVESGPKNTANFDDSNRGGGGIGRSGRGGGKGRGGGGERDGGGGNSNNGSKVNYPQDNDLPLCL